MEAGAGEVKICYGKLSVLRQGGVREIREIVENEFIVGSGKREGWMGIAHCIGQ